MNVIVLHFCMFHFTIYITNLRNAVKYIEQCFPKLYTQGYCLRFQVYWFQQSSVKQNPVIISNASVPATMIRKISAVGVLFCIYLDFFFAFNESENIYLHTYKYVYVSNRRSSLIHTYVHTLLIFTFELLMFKSH